MYSLNINDYDDYNDNDDNKEEEEEKKNKGRFYIGKGANCPQTSALPSNVT